MFDKSIPTDDGGLIKVSTRLVGAEERVMLTLSGKSGQYIVDTSSLMTESTAQELISMLNDALLSRRLAVPAEKK